MQSLPVIHRELRVAARRPATYRQRLSVGGLASGAVILFALFNPSPQSGAALFRLVSWALFMFCILEGLRQTADSLSQERREGTLGLLFLTDLKSYDVVLGKLAAAAIKSFTVLLAVLPAIALPILLGGVTAQECFGVMVALAATLLLSITSGLFVSAKSTSAFASLLISFLFVFTIIILPALFIRLGAGLPGWTAGPLEMLLQAMKGQLSVSSTRFWQAALYSAIQSSGLLWFAGWSLGRNAHLDTSLKLTGWWQRLLKPKLGLSESWGGSPANNPAVWLAERGLPGRNILWILLGTIILVCFLIGVFYGSVAIFALLPIQIVFGWLIKLWMAVLAVQPLHHARRSGALELLLCTPMTSAALIRAHADALKSYFFAPVIVAAFAPTIAMSLGNAYLSTASSGVELTPGIIFGVLWFLVFLLDMNALAYTGLWFGLTEPQLTQAVTKTVFRVLVLPLLTLLIPLLGFLGLLIWPAIWISWSASRLNKRFHQEAASHFSTDTPPPGWFTLRLQKLAAGKRLDV